MNGKFLRSAKIAAPALLLTLFFACSVKAADPQDAPPSPSPDIERLERALDDALDALATGMETLAALAERSQEKWTRCRSGDSDEAWCRKMKDALERLERLGGKDRAPAPPDQEAPPGNEYRDEPRDAPPETDQTL